MAVSNTKHATFVMTRVALPLCALTAICWWLSPPAQVDGLWINLAAGFIGSLVTILYIDVMRARQEQAAAGGVSRLLLRDVERIIDDISTLVNETVGWNYRLTTWQLDRLRDGGGHHIRWLTLETFGFNLERHGRELLDEVSAARWFQTADTLRRINIRIAQTIGYSRQYLPLDVVEALLSFQQNADEFLILHDDNGVVFNEEIRQNVADLRLVDRVRKETLDTFDRHLRAMVRACEVLSRAIINAWAE